MREALRARARAILKAEASWPEGIEALEETLELLTTAASVPRDPSPIMRVPRRADLSNTAKLVRLTLRIHRITPSASPLKALEALIHELAPGQPRSKVVDATTRATFAEAVRQVEKSLDVVL